MLYVDLWQVDEHLARVPQDAGGLLHTSTDNHQIPHHVTKSLSLSFSLIYIHKSEISFHKQIFYFMGNTNYCVSKVTLAFSSVYHDLFFSKYQMWNLKEGVPWNLKAIYCLTWCLCIYVFFFRLTLYFSERNLYEVNTSVNYHM